LPKARNPGETERIDNLNPIVQVAKFPSYPVDEQHEEAEQPANKREESDAIDVWARILR